MQKHIVIIKTCVQVIFWFAGDPESYIAGNCHSKVPPPKRCPHCGRKKCMELLGYYPRGISSALTSIPLTIRVRRFICRKFGGTVSMLPSFAQPYRLVRNSTVQKYFSGKRIEIDVIRWTPLLTRYWRRFRAWFPKLFEKAGKHSGLSPPMPTEEHYWHFFMSAWGEMSGATAHLVGTFRLTAFGIYQCHQIPIRARTALR